MVSKTAELGSIPSAPARYEYNKESLRLGGFCYTYHMTIQSDHPDDAVNVAPHLHIVIYEDAKVRVLKVIVNPGDHADMHWHPHNINYVTKGGTLRFTRQDGSSVDVELIEGQVTSSEDEVFHAVDNIGDSVVETIQVELKY